MVGEPHFAHAQSASDSPAHEQLLSPRATFVQEHWLKAGFSERWIFGHIFAEVQGFQLGVLKYYTATTSLSRSIGDCCMYSGFYTVFDSTVQHKTTENQRKYRINLSGHYNS
jgi:hypothetical protein